MPKKREELYEIFEYEFPRSENYQLFLKASSILIKTCCGFHYESYQYRSRGITRFFEKHHPGIMLRDVTAAVLSQFFTYQLQYGKINQKTHKPEPLSVRSTRSQRSILYAVFNQGIIDGLIIQTLPLQCRHPQKRKRILRKKCFFCPKKKLRSF